MTTIEAGSNRIIFRDEGEQMHVLIECRSARPATLGVFVSHADLYAALNVVPKTSAWGELQETCGALASELREAQAQRDALAKTVERVREALSRHPEPCTETEFTCGWKGAVVDLRSAIDPELFTLPTEAGVRFYAEDPEGDSFVFKTLIGGREPLYIADDDQDQVCNADELTGWQNFRLLDGAE